jgi:hypothetical protein
MHTQKMGQKAEPSIPARPHENRLQPTPMTTSPLPLPAPGSPPLKVTMRETDRPDPIDVSPIECLDHNGVHQAPLSHNHPCRHVPAKKTTTGWPGSEEENAPVLLIIPNLGK